MCAMKSMKAMQAMKKLKAPTNAQMDMANRALCYALRKPGKGTKPTPYSKIIKNKLVRKTDGTVPTPGAIADAAKNFLKLCKVPGTI